MSNNGWQGKVIVEKLTGFPKGHTIAKIQLDVTNNGSAQQNGLLNNQNLENTIFPGQIDVAKFTNFPPGGSLDFLGLLITDTGAGNKSATHNNQATNSDGWAGNVIVQKFTGLTPNALINKLTLDVTATGGNVRLKFYADDGPSGTPSTLISETGSISIPSTGFQNFTVSASVPSDGVIYAGFETNGTLGLAYTNPGPDTMRVVAHTYGSGPNPFGTGSSYTQEQYMVLYYTNPTPHVRVKAFDDTGSNGLPGKLVGQGSPILVSAIGHQNFTFANGTVPSDGVVWAGFEFDSGTRFRYSTFAGNNSYTTFHTFGSGPSSFGTPTGINAQPYYNLFSTPVSPHVRVKAYDDSGAGGLPGKLLGESGSLPVGVAGFRNYTLTGTIPSDGVLWAGFELNSVSSIKYDSPIVEPTRYVNHTYGSGPNPFGSSASYTNEPFLAVYYIGNTTAVSLQWDASTLSTTPQITYPDDMGRFTGFFNVPSAPTGNHTVSASDNAHTASALFLVTGTLTLNPPSGGSYTNVSVTGTGYHTNSLVTIKMDGSLQGFNNPTTSGSGSFSSIISIPAAGPGQHTIQACDASNTCESAIFTLTSANISNFAFASQITNTTSIYPVITTNTPLLALSQSLYFVNNTLSNTITYNAPISINADTATNLQTWTNTISSTVAYYENVTLTDGFNQYTVKSRTVSFTPIPNPNPNGIGSINPSSSTSNPNLTPGLQNFTQTNPNQVKILFKRVDLNSTLTNLQVTYPNNFNLTCNLIFAVAQVNKTYVNIPSVPFGSSQVLSTFAFKNINNDIVTTNCTDKSTGTSGEYVLTQNSNGVPNFPITQYIKNFRSGQYGTHGQIGTIDIISLISIFLAMVGLSRVNEAAGIILATIVLGFLAFFQIIQWPTLVTGAIAVVVMIAVTSTKKLPWSQ